MFRSRSQSNLGPNEELRAGGERLQAKPNLSSRKRGSDAHQGEEGFHQGFHQGGGEGFQAKPNLSASQCSSRRTSDARKGSAKELAVIDHIV